MNCLLLLLNKPDFVDWKSFKVSKLTGKRVAKGANNCRLKKNFLTGLQRDGLLSSTNEYIQQS